MTFIRIAFVKEAKFVLYANRKVADRFILDNTLPEKIDIKVFKLPLREANRFGINSTWKNVSEKWKNLQIQSPEKPKNLPILQKAKQNTC